MIKSIDKNQLNEFHNTLPFNYATYIAWLDEEVDGTGIYYLSTSKVQIREQDKWNSEGREIYDEDILKSHAIAVIELLGLIDCSKFIVEHEYKTWPWLPSNIINNKDVRNMESFFQKCLPDVNSGFFDGAICIQGEIDKFLRNFIGYPYRLKYRDLDCLSCEKPLVVKITHHLSVDFITWDEEIFKNIEKIAKQLGLNVIIGEA